MPLEIRELTIQINLSQEQNISTGAAPASVAASSTGQNNPGNQEALLQELVEKVLDILKSKAER